MVRNEGGAATDTVSTINNGVQGQFLMLQPADVGKTLVLTNADNITLDGATSRTLNSVTDKIYLFYFSGWTQIAFAGN